MILRLSDALSGEDRSYDDIEGMNCKTTFRLENESE